MRKLSNLLLAAVLLLAVSTSAFAKGRVIVVVGDPPGTGFSDPTPASSVPSALRGDNPGATLGELRTNALREAARIWSERLDSKTDIIVRAFFTSRPCTATSATLASAGATEIWTGVPNARPDFIYGSALANKTAGEDLHPFATDDPISQEITARFNKDIGQTGCLTGTFWYYGLDGNEGTNIDMVATAIHEMGHGLGFQTFNDRTTGQWPFDDEGNQYPDPYGALISDVTLGKGWLDMSDAERKTSALNTGNLVFVGQNLDSAFHDVLKGTPVLRVNAPAPIATQLDVGVADFGGTIGSPEITGNIVIGRSPSTTVPGTFDTLGCAPFTNAGDIAGKVLYVDRGTCTFTIKGQNALAAGAIAVVIGDNAPGPPAGLTGSVPGLTAPVMRITQALGAAIKQQIGLGLTVNVTIAVDTTRLPGVTAGHVRLYAPNPLVLGSSTSHFDDVAFPNLIMEPAINHDLGHSPEPPKDLTLPVFRDIGWYPDEDVDLVADAVDSCLGSSEAATVLGGVPNVTNSSGCKLSDRVKACRADGDANHGQFVSCMNVAEAEFTGAGLITKEQAKALHNAVAHDDQQ